MLKLPVRSRLFNVYRRSLQGQQVFCSRKDFRTLCFLSNTNRLNFFFLITFKKGSKKKQASLTAYMLINCYNINNKKKYLPSH